MHDRSAYIPGHFKTSFIRTAHGEMGGEGVLLASKQIEVVFTPCFFFYQYENAAGKKMITSYPTKIRKS